MHGVYTVHAMHPSLQVCRLLGPTTVAYSIFGDHGAFCQGFNWLLT